MNTDDSDHSDDDVIINGYQLDKCINIKVIIKTVTYNKCIGIDVYLISAASNESVHDVLTSHFPDTNWNTYRVVVKIPGGEAEIAPKMYPVRSLKKLNALPTILLYPMTFSPICRFVTDIIRDKKINKKKSHVSQILKTTTHNDINTLNNLGSSNPTMSPLNSNLNLNLNVTDTIPDISYMSSDMIPDINYMSSDT